MAILDLRVTKWAVAALMISCLGACASGPGGVRPVNKGSSQMGLTSCPPRPSCVSSRDTGGIHGIAPLKFQGDGAVALQRIREILARMPRTKIIDANDGYLHATQSSSVFGFTDDVEFLLDPENAQIQARSCARVGFFDFGVNRRRIEQVRSELN